MLRQLAIRLTQRGVADVEAVTPHRKTAAATTASVCDLLIGNNLLQGYLGGADALCLEVVSKRHPFGKDALRNRTLLRFPSNDEGFSTVEVAFASHSGSLPEHTNYRRRNIDHGLHRRRQSPLPTCPDDRVGRRIPAAPARAPSTGSLLVRGAIWSARSTRASS